MAEPVAAPRFSAILLAAGPSSRLGRSKQLATYEGEALVRRAARLIIGLSPERLLAVCGHEAEQVEAQLAGLELETVRNANWSQGMGASIVCGARAMPEGPEGILVMVCDQWRLDGVELARLVRHWRADPSKIYVANWKESGALVSGPPVMFPGSLLRQLRGLSPQRGARQVIDGNMEIVDYVEVPSAACDLDRAEDLERMLRDEGKPFSADA